jgi:hypothetical protein
LAAVAARPGPGVLEVGRVDDPLEHEAERVAERLTATTPGRRRTCACGGTPGPDGECAACKARRLGLRRKPAGGGGTAGRAPAVVHEVLSSPGRPLEPATRTDMEQGLGRGLGDVRVHTGDRAAASARAVGAVAYTVGSDIVFARGRHAPGTPEGRRLLAHELAHVVQQRGGTALLQRQAITPTCNAVAFDPETQACCNGFVIPGPATQDVPGCANVTTRDNEYDGCSVPEIMITLSGVDPDNPVGRPDSRFSDPSIHGTQPPGVVPLLPCDVHDKCYQTCGSDRTACDNRLFSDAGEVCRTAQLSRRDYIYCTEVVDEMREKLPLGSYFAFSSRQREYCACCPGQAAPVLSKTSAIVKFATGSSRFDVAALGVLDDFVAANRAILIGTNYDLMLVGHASRLGFEDDNERLSNERVAAVRGAIARRLDRPDIPGRVDPHPLGEQLAGVTPGLDPADDSPDYRVVEIILVGY